MKTNRFIKEYQPIQIKEPYKPEVLEFNDTNDFTRYYREHEDEFKDLSTYKLNVKYKIPGYKISLKGKKSNTPELILIKNSIPHNDNTDLSSVIQKIDELYRRMEELSTRITNIENYLSNNS